MMCDSQMTNNSNLRHALANLQKRNQTYLLGVPHHWTIVQLSVSQWKTGQMVISVH